MFASTMKHGLVALAAGFAMTTSGRGADRGQRRRLRAGICLGESLRRLGDRKDRGASRLREEGGDHRQHGIWRRGDGAPEGAPRSRQRHRQIRPGDARQRRRRADLQLCRLSRAARRLSRQGHRLFRRRQGLPAVPRRQPGRRQALGAALLFVRRRGDLPQGHLRQIRHHRASPRPPRSSKRRCRPSRKASPRTAITDIYALTMRGAPGEEPSLDLAGFVYAYAGYPRLVRGRRDHARRRSRRRRRSRYSPATSRTASRPSSAGRRNSVRRASPPTPGST